MTTVASSLGFRLHVVKVNATDHLSRAFAEMVAANAEALVVIEDPTFVAIAKSIADLALSHHLPTMLGNRLYVYAGGLMAYGLGVQRSLASRCEIRR